MLAKEQFAALEDKITSPPFLSKIPGEDESR
jgi:hypothetical protein